MVRSIGTVTLVRGLPLITYKPRGEALKGTKRQCSGQASQFFKSVKSIEIQPVRKTEAFGKV